MGKQIGAVSVRNQRRGAMLFTAGGIASAFGVAACCALPLLFAAAGIGTAWLAGIAALSAPYRSGLIIVSLISLLASAALLWRIEQNARRCGGDAVGTPVWLRLGLWAGLVVGSCLLAAGYLYV
nr:mercuric reductase [uncultured Sphingomonas sp.]